MRFRALANWLRVVSAMKGNPPLKCRELLELKNGKLFGTPFRVIKISVGPVYTNAYSSNMISYCILIEILNECFDLIG